jgi:hypothetical protein
MKSRKRWAYLLCHVRPAICLHVTYPTTEERIFMKFNIWAFYKNSSKRARFDYKRPKITDTSHEDPHMLHCASHGQESQ